MPVPASVRFLPPGVHGAGALLPGDRIECGSIMVTAEMIDTFAALTGDRFEIHISEQAARRHGFDGRVAHGLLVLSLVDGLKNQAAAQIRARASRGWDWRFRAPVFAGDTVSVQMQVTGIHASKSPDQAFVSLEFHVLNEDGVAVQTGTNSLLAYR